jgi:hypothetical protein
MRLQCNLNIFRFTITGLKRHHNHLTYSKHIMFSSKQFPTCTIVVKEFYTQQWLHFNFAEEYDAIYWCITHDRVDDVLPGYEFNTKICYLTDRGEGEKIQVQNIAK